MATDAEIRAAGFYAIPNRQYLQDEFQLPTKKVVEEETESFGIPNTNAFNNSGNGFSVYNPDPNSIVNREYRPNYDYRQFSEYDSDPSTADIKQMDMNQNYFNEPPPSKMEGILNMIPGAGIARFLTNQIGPYTPVNRRSIMENELGRQGIMVDDIGRIVRGTGDYNTAQNVMAGYGAGVTQKTVDKRQGTIEKTLADKYNMSPIDIAAVKAGTYKGEVLNKTDLISRYGALDKFGNTLDSTNKKVDKMKEFEEEEKEKKKKDTVVGRYLTKRKETKAAKEAKAGDETSAENYPTGGSYDASGGVTGADYNQVANIRGGGGGNTRNAQGQTAREATYDNDKTTGTAQSYSQHYADGGRAGYFFGGRVNYKVGGRVSFKNGGLASIL